MLTIHELEAEIILIRSETNECKLNILNILNILGEAKEKQEQILHLNGVVERLDNTIIDLRNLRTELQNKVNQG